MNSSYSDSHAQGNATTDIVMETLTPAQHQFALDFGLDRDMVIQSGIGRALLLSYFIPLTVIGTLGNCWLISSVLRILVRRWFPLNLLFRQISLYILTLSIVDLAVVLSIPMLLYYALSGHWLFGTVGCKLFFAVENGNKLLSVLVLAIMSFERFLAICRPLQWLGIHFGQNKKAAANSAFTVLACLLFTVALLCAPMVYFAQENYHMYVYPNGGMKWGNSNCDSRLPDNLMPLFICYMLLFGFVLPLPLIACSYFFIIRHLRQKPDGFISSYSARAVRSILRVVIFHFLCWTPFWVFVMLPLVLHMEPLLKLDSTNCLRMVSSFLPYLNSALNWIFYGMMNRQLRESSSTLLTGRHSCMPLSSSLHRSTTFTSTITSKRRSTRSLLIASSRV